MRTSSIHNDGSIPLPLLFPHPKYLLIFLVLSIGCQWEGVVAGPQPGAPRASSLALPPLSRSPCPQVLGCSCVGDDPTRVYCNKITHVEIGSLATLYPRLSHLKITVWGEYVLDMQRISALSALSNLTITGSEIYSILRANKTMPTLRNIEISGSWLRDYTAVCNLTRSVDRLDTLDLHSNDLRSVDECVAIKELPMDALILRENKISSIAPSHSLPSSLHLLDLSSNQLSNISSSLPSLLHELKLSGNPLHTLDIGVMKELLSLNLSDTNFDTLPRLNAPVLETVVLDRSSLTFADFTRWKTPLLTSMSMTNVNKLNLVYGRLPSTTKNVNITNTQLKTLPDTFFEGLSLRSLTLIGNQWECDKCIFRWSQKVKNLLGDTGCAPSTATAEECKLGCSNDLPVMVRARYGHDAILSCGCYGYPEPEIEWWVYRPKEKLGRFHPVNNTADLLGNTTKIHGKYQILPNGLSFQSVGRDHVERYVCVAKNRHGSAYRIVRFRLDYSHWYSFDIFDSVFWGCCLMSLVVCAISFLLNVTWIISRKSILWWIHRAERLSRVRKMVEAMEKYRARQMENLHDKYAKKVQNVRENYHQQVEQLRSSYASQAERFRDYREAKIENVTSHLEGMRDNYNQQMQRVREYGSRRAEQLWESYERQANRMRTFSLQHRLKLMRQYKVKQRYLNKLLESFNDVHSPEAMRQHEEEVRAALDALKEGHMGDVDEDPTSGVIVEEIEDPPGSSGINPLSRASSFYSLPEYVLDENGELRPSGVTTVRFHNREELRPLTRSTVSSHHTPRKIPLSIDRTQESDTVTSPVAGPSRASFNGSTTVPVASTALQEEILEETQSSPPKLSKKEEKKREKEEKKKEKEDKKQREKEEKQAKKEAKEGKNGDVEKK